MPDNAQNHGVMIALPMLFDLKDQLGKMPSLNDRQRLKVEYLVLNFLHDHGLLERRLGLIGPARGVYPTPPLSEEIPEMPEAAIAYLREIRGETCAAGAEEPNPTPTCHECGGLVYIGDACCPVCSPEAQKEAAHTDAFEELPERDPAQSAATTDGDLKSGPLSEFEKNVMESAKLRGDDPKEVAQALNRRVQTVAMFMAKIDLEADPDVPDVPDEPADTTQKPAPAPASVLERRSEWWRAEDARLNALGYANGWSASDDLELVDRLMKGEIWPVLEDEFARPKRDLVNRWRVLMDCSEGEPPRLEDQQRVRKVLFARAATVEALG